MLVFHEGRKTRSIVAIMAGTALAACLVISMTVASVDNFQDVELFTGMASVIE